MSEREGSLKDWVAGQGEEAFGKLAEELLGHPVTHATLGAVFAARDRVSQIQGLVMNALNLPSAADIERLTRRTRSVSQRVEGIEDGLDRIIQRLEDVGSGAALDARLNAIEQGLRDLQAAVVGADAPGAATSEQDPEPGNGKPVDGGSGAVDAAPAGAADSGADPGSDSEPADGSASNEAPAE
jgi:hypothetical protein